MLSFIVFMALYIRITAKPKAIKKSNKILTKAKFIRKHELRANIPEPNKKILHIFTESSLLAYLDIRTFRSFSVYVFFPIFICIIVGDVVPFAELTLQCVCLRVGVFSFTSLKFCMVV